MQTSSTPVKRLNALVKAKLRKQTKQPRKTNFSNPEFESPPTVQSKDLTQQSHFGEKKITHIKK